MPVDRCMRDEPSRLRTSFMLGAVSGGIICGAAVMLATLAGLGPIWGAVVAASTLAGFLLVEVVRGRP